MTNFLFRYRWSASDVFMAAVSLLIVVWAALPTRVFLKPVFLQVAQNQVTFARDVPFGQVMARWYVEVRVGLDECYAPGGLTKYQTGPSGERYNVLVQYQLHEDLRRCASMGQPFVVSQTHQVYAFGALPLRPSETLWACIAPEEPCTVAKER